MSFSQIINIAFVIYAKVTTRDVLLIPSVERQRGKRWNYIVVCQGDYAGVYKYSVDLIPSLRIWDNKGRKCYIISLDKVQKIKNIEDLDITKPLGKYISHTVRKINEKS